MKLETRLKETFVSSIPILFGVGLGGIARLTDSPEIIAAPLLIDLIGGMPIYDSKSNAAYCYSLIKYGLGASLFWIDKVDYSVLVDSLANLY